MKRETMTSASGIARLAGGLDLAMMPFGFFGIVYVPMALVVPGDAPATAENITTSELLFRSGVVSHLIAQIIFIFLVLTLFRLLERVNKRHAVLMVVLALVGIPMAALSDVNHLAVLEVLGGAGEDAFTRMMLFLEMREQGILVTQIFWGLWLMPLGLLVFESGFLPKLLGILLAIAGAGYAIDSATQLLFPDVTTISQFTFVGEVLFTLWLLIKGVNVKRWQEATVRKEGNYPT